MRSRENHKKELKDRDAGEAVGQGKKKKKSLGHFKRIKNKKIVTNYSGFCFINDANSKIITEITEKFPRQ